MKIQSHACQDYLKAIYDLQTSRERVATTALATHLGVKPSSVTVMVRKLSDIRPQLVNYKSHRGVKLTPTGRIAAVALVRRHRLIEQLLVTTLGFEWDQVHEEAHRLEHCVSDLFIEKVDALLNHPKVDPHGQPIPTATGSFTAAEVTCVADVPLNTVFYIARVGSEEQTFLKHLSRIGLQLKVPVCVREVTPAADTLTMEILGRSTNTTKNARKKTTRVIGMSLARQIFVSKAQ